MRGRLTVSVVGRGRTRWRPGLSAASVVVPASGPSGLTASSWAGSSGARGTWAPGSGEPDGWAGASGLQSWRAVEVGGDGETGVVTTAVLWGTEGAPFSGWRYALKHRPG